MPDAQRPHSELAETVRAGFWVVDDEPVVREAVAALDSLVEQFAVLERERNKAVREAAIMDMTDATATAAAKDRIRDLEEQFDALRAAAERVVAADNQSLGAMGEEGGRAQVEIIDALDALRVLLASDPAKRPA